MPPSPFPIIDSHIHLYPASELPTLAWCPPGHPLHAQHSLDEYALATGTLPPSLRGFIFVETDRRSAPSPDPADWALPLQEISWISRVAAGRPLPGEGHAAAHARLCLGIVPWAPLPAGAGVLERYVALAREAAGGDDVWARVRGFRFLAQDKPAGTMLGEGFVEGMRWLGERGWAFELGVDMHRGGVGQLDEAVEMLGRVYEGVERGEDRVVVVIDHLCKPDIREDDEATTALDTWTTRITQLAAFPTTFMKLSGSFSELPQAQPTDHPASARAVAATLRPWFATALAAFGASRIMFGSDWPVCNLRGGGNDYAWGNWRAVVEELLEMCGVEEGDKREIWAGTAARAYRLHVEGVQ